MKRNVEGGTKMGTYKGGSPTYRKLQENYDKIKESYPVSNGYIGKGWLKWE